MTTQVAELTSSAFTFFLLPSKHFILSQVLLAATLMDMFYPLKMRTASTRIEHWKCSVG